MMEVEELFAYPTVTAIVERECNGEKEVLVQIRRDDHPQYDNTLELPSGKIRAGESPFDALQREVREETGLEVVEVTCCRAASRDDSVQDPSFAFTPFACVCQQIAERSWVGFVFRCRVVKEDSLVAQESEVKRVYWMKQSELRKLFLAHPEKINSFNRAILPLYFSVK